MKDTVTIRVIKEIDDDGKDVPFTDPDELDHAMTEFHKQVGEAEWGGFGPTFWTVVVSDA